MKAEINGIKVEGTPKEIMEFKNLQEEKVAKKNLNIPNNPIKPYVKGGWVATGCPADVIVTLT
jgi:hypothetical protein